jgi:hypothetical protein
MDPLAALFALSAVSGIASSAVTVCEYLEKKS